MRREISKLPKTPKFGDKLIQLTTDFIFQPDASYDLSGKTLFICSIANLNAMIRKFSELKNVPESKIVISGGINPVYKKLSPETILMKLMSRRNFIEWKDILGKPESHIILEALDENFILPAHIGTETESLNTRENWVNSRNFESMKNPDGIVVLSDATYALRSKLTARAVLPAEVGIETISYEAHYNGPFMNDMKFPFLNLHASRDGWSENFFARKMVWSEVLRIKKYGDKGDLVIDAANAEKLKEIMQHCR
ncbi:MAG: hypothetical protein LBG89_02230 [Rickettsiales bacterium]|jgi:hypothetical protein|nr:hypothetical protein [Rickettsiales bacterium]